MRYCVRFQLSDKISIVLQICGAKMALVLAESRLCDMQSSLGSNRHAKLTLHINVHGCENGVRSLVKCWQTQNFPSLDVAHIAHYWKQDSDSNTLWQLGEL